MTMTKRKRKTRYVIIHHVSMKNVAAGDDETLDISHDEQHSMFMLRCIVVVLSCRMIFGIDEYGQ
jgi:hypothetical protein